MDTAEKEVSCFVNLPPDIWAYLVLLLPGEQLGRLKMTGARSIWRRLVFPGVVKSVKLGTDFLQFESWPAFLNEFPSLEELSIHVFNASLWDKEGLKLDLIPSRLRKLQFIGRATWPLDFPIGKEFSQLEKIVPRLESLDLTDLMLLQVDSISCAWMAHLPSNLTILKIPRWDGLVELPPSLIHLQARQTSFLGMRNVKKLPRLLETLSISMVDIWEHLFPLPPSLLRFDTQTHLRDGVSIERLPRSLTSLRVKTLDISDLLPPAILSLPPTLTELQVTYSIFPSAIWCTLPKTVTKLECLISKSSYCVSSGSILNPSAGNVGDAPILPFNTLPRSITHLALRTHLQLTAIYPPGDSTNFPYFPPRLTFLSIPNINLTPEAAAQLPSSLTHVELCRLCERVCKYLPNGLTTLLARMALMSPSLIKFLPKSLNSVQLNFVDDLDIWMDHNLGEMIEFVPSMSGYQIHEDYNAWIGESSLPPNLIHLILRHLSKLTDSFIMNHSFANLLTLDLSNSSLITDLSIPFLGRHLSTLHLSESNLVTGKSFPDLPTSLTNLNLSNSNSVSDGDIQHLPRTLKVLGLSSAVELTNLCTPDFPRQLEYLGLHSNQNITPDSLPYLPYALRSPQAVFEKSVILKTWFIRYGRPELWR